MKVLVAHPGTQYSYQLVKQLEQHGLLYKFYTGLAMAEDGFIQKLHSLLPSSLQRKISNRIINAVPAKKIKTIPFPELKAIRLLRKNIDTEEILFQRNKRFQELIPDNAIKQADIVIGFDTSSWILIERCKHFGKKFILDVSIAHPTSKQKVYKQISKDFPLWNFALKNKSKYLVDIEQQELNHADAVVVASTFTKKTLIENNISESKIFVNPYGVDSRDFFPAIKKKQVALNFVFVGIVDARKGVPLLLDVWKKIALSEATLTLIGPIDEEVRKMIQSSHPTIIIKGKVPFTELKQIVPQYDVLIFPSYFEGFGLVILEAMASGVPVITTNATCGADLIDHEVDGVLFETGNATQLFTYLQSFINQRYNKLEMGKRAREKAMQYSWDAYGERWTSVLIKTITS